MGNLVCKMSVGIFKLLTSDFTVMEGYISGVQLNSQGIKLGGEITNSGVEMGNLVCKMVVGFFELMASGFTG